MANFKFLISDSKILWLKAKNALTQLQLTPGVNYDLFIMNSGHTLKMDDKDAYDGEKRQLYIVAGAVITHEPTENPDAAKQMYDDIGKDLYKTLNKYVKLFDSSNSALGLAYKHIEVTFILEMPQSGIEHNAESLLLTLSIIDILKDDKTYKKCQLSETHIKDNKFGEDCVALKNQFPKLISNEKKPVAILFRIAYGIK